MKPKEAIEIQTDMRDEVKIADPADKHDALQLGIEALDFFIEFQRVMGNNKDARLPSETKD